jgi:hypothetical protein
MRYPNNNSTIRRFLTIRRTICKDFSKLTENDYYHIQIHFKRPVKRAPGSIDFDKDKEYLKREILRPVLR